MTICLEKNLKLSGSLTKDKCEILSITRKKHPVTYPYQLHGQHLKHCDYAKYLGITISKDMRWTRHIDTITAKANSKLGFVKRNININNRHRLINHRLNGSSSPVLTATSLSYGKTKNSTPPQNQNPWSDWDKIWQGWLRQGVDPSCKILCKSLQRGLLGKCVKYTQKLYLIYDFSFLPLTHRSDLLKDFYA